MKLKITIDNKTYEVDVEAAEPEAPAPPAFGYAAGPAPVRMTASAPSTALPSTSGSPVDEGKVCRSPVSGIVVKVVAREGQSLQVGDVLLVLEAMKMETDITSPVTGKVAAIKVQAGDSVQNGQVVVEFA